MAEVFFDPRMGCFHALTATGFFQALEALRRGLFRALQTR